MNQIYIVKVKTGEYEDIAISDVCAFMKENDAQNKVDELNKKYSSIVDVNDYIDAEVYVTNDLIETTKCKADSFENFVDAMLEQLEDDEHFPRILDSWRELKRLFKASEFTNYYDYFNHHFGNIHIRALALYIFTNKLRHHTIQEIEDAIDIYQASWSRPKAFYTKLQLID